MNVIRPTSDGIRNNVEREPQASGVGRVPCFAPDNSIMADRNAREVDAVLQA